jgi:deoxyribodipyrimidine photo-lyase
MQGQAKGPMNLRREFKDRDDLLDYLRTQFPNAPGGLSPQRGGRHAAEQLLSSFPASRYAATRNFLNGSVSRLSPYLRHGVITLREVLDHVRRTFTGQRLDKFVQELAWRDYWQRVYASVGEGIWQDREPSKTGAVYTSALPADWGSTGLACMDSFVAELESTGYLHNHSRLWLASYLVHWRRVAWQTGARWFLQHLVDGDPASNNLSWQWVASTFSSKPYYFNRENLEHYSEGRYCGSCQCRNHCPFNKDYAALANELFPEIAAS